MAVTTLAGFYEVRETRAMKLAKDFCGPDAAGPPGPNPMPSRTRGCASFVSKYSCGRHTVFRGDVHQTLNSSCKISHKHTPRSTAISQHRNSKICCWRTGDKQAAVASRSVAGGASVRWWAATHLAEGFLQLLEVGGLVEAAGQHLGEQRLHQVPRHEQHLHP